MDVFGIVQQAHEHVLVLEKLYAKNMSEHEYICWCAELLIIFIHKAHYSIFFCDCDFDFEKNMDL